MVHLWLVGKHVVDFLLVLIQLFSPALTVEALWANISRNRGVRKGVGHFESKFQGEWGSPTIESWHQKTRVRGLSHGVVCVMLRLAILIQYRLVTHTHTHDDGYYPFIASTARVKTKNNMRVIFRPFAWTPPMGQSVWIFFRLLGHIASENSLAEFCHYLFVGFGVLLPPILPFFIASYNGVITTMLHWCRLTALSSSICMSNYHQMGMTWSLCNSLASYQYNSGFNEFKTDQPQMEVCRQVHSWH